MANAAEKFKAKVPAAVRRQARKAERDHAKVYSPQPPEGDASVVAMQQGLNALPAEPPAEPPVEPQAPPAEPQTAQTAQTAQAAQAASDDDLTWEQRYRSLQGMMDREVSEKRALMSRIDGLEATLATISSIRETPANQPANQPAEKWSRRLKKEDIDAYGEDMVEMVRAAAHDEFMPVIDNLRAENAELKEQLGQVTTVTQQSAAQSVETLLDREIPNWKTINTDPEFIDWLAQEDAFSGRTRHELLNAAGTNGPRVVSFFKAYLNERQAIRGHSEATSAVPQHSQAPQGGPTVNPTSLVAPGRPAAPSTGADAAVDHEEPQFFTQKQIAAFYREVQKGKWKHRPAEKLKLEQAIHKAAVEGRVRA